MIVRWVYIVFYLPQESRLSWENVCLRPEHTYNAEKMRGLILLKPVWRGVRAADLGHRDDGIAFGLIRN